MGTMIKAMIKAMNLVVSSASRPPRLGKAEHKCDRF